MPRENKKTEEKVSSCSMGDLHEIMTHINL